MLAAAAIVAGLLLMAGSAGGDATFPDDIDADAAPDNERIARGRYLALAGNCVACHTAPGDTPMAGGLRFETDFGAIYSTNITPDRATGIGNWSANDFLRSMRYGLRPGGEHLYPAFPYPSFTHMSDGDLADLWAYLQSIDPVQRQNEENDLRFPFSLRPLLGVWKSLYFDVGSFEADPARSEEWNRGAYLVDALTHCGECHSPRNRLGAVDEDRVMAGGAYLDRVAGGDYRRWSAPNLTQSERGLGTWSQEDLQQYLGTGRNDFLETFGPMNEVIVNSTRHLRPEDIDAIVAYLTSLAAIDPPAEADVDSRTLGMGRTQYNLHCGTCHLPSGEGDPEMAPRIGGGSLVTRSADPATLINVILYGPELADLGEPSEWRNPMDAFRYLLDDDEVAALASYVRHSWGNGGGRVRAETVQQQRSSR